MSAAGHAWIAGGAVAAAVPVVWQALGRFGGFTDDGDEFRRDLAALPVMRSQAVVDGEPLMPSAGVTRHVRVRNRHRAAGR